MTSTSPTRHHPRPRPTTLAGALTGAVLALVLAGCDGVQHPERYGDDVAPLPEVTSSSVEVTRAEFGETWPLSVDHGTIDCHDSEQVIFTAPDGEQYGLNQRALDAGYADPGAITPSEQRISIGPLFSYGLRTCEQ